MNSLSAPYLQILIIVSLLSFPFSIFSQEEEVLDTTEYMDSFRSPYRQAELNNYLMIASAEGEVKAIHWLIKNGAEINSRTNENISPLMFAVANNYTEAVKALLMYNPYVDLFSAYNETPLLIAVKNGNLEITEALVRDSANINLADKHGATPLHYASIYGYFYIVDMLLYYEAANDTKTDDGITPLMAAIWAGFADIADLHIQDSANVEERDNTGFTPLLLAAQNGDTLIMEMLLKHRVNLYEVNNYGYDALDLCIKSNHKEAAEYLLGKGDEWASKGNNIINPYSVAAKYNRKEIAVLLKENNIPETYRFGFDQVAFSASFKVSFHDFFTGINIAFKEPSLNGGIVAGFDLKPLYTRVLIEENESSYYQYFDRRSIAFGGIFKDFTIVDSPLKGNWLLSCSLAVGYTFGNKMKGTNIVPEKKIKIIPSAGFKWTKNNINLFGGIEYIKTEFYKVGPVWLRLGGSYTLFFDKIRAPGKDIKWY